MTTMNLGFVILYVQDMEKSRAFYSNVIGLTVVPEVSSDTFVTLRGTGGALLALQDKTAAVYAPKYEEHGGSVELSFEVDDVEATWQRWHEQGVTLLSEPANIPGGRYFLAKDPEGHYLSAYRFNAHER